MKVSCLGMHSVGQVGEVLSFTKILGVCAQGLFATQLSLKKQFPLVFTIVPGFFCRLCAFRAVRSSTESEPTPAARKPRRPPLVRGGGPLRAAAAARKGAEGRRLWRGGGAAVG